MTLLVSLRSSLAREGSIASSPAAPGSAVLPEQDGPGSVWVPTTAEAWAARSLPAPSTLFGCQDLAGDLQPAIGTAVLTANGSGHLFGQVVPGWTRRFVGLTDGTTANFMDQSNADLNWTAAQSAAWLLYFSIQSGASATRIPFQTNGTGNCLGLLSGTGAFRTTHGGSGSAVTGGSPSNIDLVRAVIWYRNATTNASGTIWNLGAGVGFHNESAASNLARGFGSSDATLRSANARYCLAAAWKGANAETIGQASTLTALGW